VERVAQEAPDDPADAHGHEARGDRGLDVGERAPSPQDDAHDGDLRSQQIVEMREESGSHPSGSARIGCGAERQGAGSSYVDFGVNMNQGRLAKYPQMTFGFPSLETPVRTKSQPVNRVRHRDRESHYRQVGNLTQERHDEEIGLDTSGTA
jgi:hypothetical protein